MFFQCDSLLLDRVSLPLCNAAEWSHGKTGLFSECLYTVPSVEYRALPPWTDMGHCPNSLTKSPFWIEQDGSRQQSYLTRRRGDSTRWADCPVSTLFRTESRHRRKRPWKGVRACTAFHTLRYGCDGGFCLFDTQGRGTRPAVFENTCARCQKCVSVGEGSGQS